MKSCIRCEKPVNETNARQMQAQEQKQREIEAAWAQREMEIKAVRSIMNCLEAADWKDLTTPEYYEE